MENQWISVKECAELGQISTQAIYKKLNHKKNQENFAGHIKTIMGKKYLDEEAVKLVLGTFGSNNKKDPVEQEILKILSELDERNRKKILNFARQTLEVSKY